MKAIFIFGLLQFINEIGSRKDTYCNFPIGCEFREMVGIETSKIEKYLVCSISEKSRFKIDINRTNETIDDKQCQQREITTFLLKPKSTSKKILTKQSIDFISLTEYLDRIKNHFALEFISFKGFDLDLFDASEFDYLQYDNSGIEFEGVVCIECQFTFYSSDGKEIKSCQEFGENQNSIFQLFSRLQIAFLQELHFYIFISELKNKICPLAFKNVALTTIYFLGHNSYFSRKLIEFSNESFSDLNSYIHMVEINIENVEIDFKLFHPSVFNETLSILIENQVKYINPEFFIVFRNVQNIVFKTHYIRSLIHKQGIEWIKNINKDLHFNLSNPNDFYEYRNSTFLIFLDCDNNIFSLPMCQVFPDEDFCIYIDFPFDQMIILIHNCEENEFYQFINKKVSCTYLWLVQFMPYYYINYPNFNFTYHLRNLILSDDFQSMSKCNFESRISMCNKSNYQIKPLLTYFEIGESMKLLKTIIYISAYFVSLFGIVTNLLVIITISSKENTADFKGLNQYDYMRINSICSCLILTIHILSWITDCVYPYELFCPEIRKTLFLQYFKIIVIEVFDASLRFMNNFVYIAFSLCRIALIGKDHNKLVKFIAEVGITKYTIVSLIISLIFSVVKYFSYKINYGFESFSYPIEYDYQSVIAKGSRIYFIINFSSDLLNYIVFLLVHLAIDIGMVRKLRETLNEKLEKSKEYSTKEQNDKRKSENESVINNAIFMVILNTVVGILLKLPTCIYSLIFMYYNIYKINYLNYWIHAGFGRFFKYVCLDSSFCDAISVIANFLYLLYISIQFFFYKRFDKKFKNSFEKRFYSKNYEIK